MAVREFVRRARPKRPIMVRIDQATADALRAQAGQQRRSLSTLAEIAIEMYLRNLDSLSLEQEEHDAERLPLPR